MEIYADKLRKGKEYAKEGGIIMLGEGTFQPYAVNTFSKRGKHFTTITPAHYVNPHNVQSYIRKDGTFVSGYWRDGDGDTTINRSIGYFARNPNAIPQVMKKGGKV